MSSHAPPAYPWKHGAPRTVFITGASSGIGRDMARRLAAEGASIALFNRSAAEDVLAELRTAARSADQGFACYRADVADARAIEAAVTQAVQDMGAPDLAIHSAGVLHNAPAYSTEGIEIWFARGLSAGDRRLDDGEFIELCLLTEEELERRAAAGERRDPAIETGL